MDGASIWHKIWHVTLPQLRGVLLITLILQLIGTAQVFLEPYLFTDGGPANSTLTVLLLIYNYAFGNSLGGDYGAATALSVMLAASSPSCPPSTSGPPASMEHVVIERPPALESRSYDWHGGAASASTDWHRTGGAARRRRGRS